MFLNTLFGGICLTIFMNFPIWIICFLYLREKRNNPKEMKKAEEDFFRISKEIFEKRKARKNDKFNK